MENKILVIAGMHRSGTSLISQWLHHCGLHLGDRLLGPAIGNAEGHYEDLDFLALHEEILQEKYASTLGYVQKPVSPLSVYQKEKMRSVIHFKNTLRTQWGWKEPRTCLFLNLYLEIMPNARYLIMIRDYRETVSSLIQRDMKIQDLHYAGKNWLSQQNWRRRRRAVREREMYYSKSEFYLRVWVTYNEAILQLMSFLPEHQFIVADHQLLNQQNLQIFDTLVNEWDFSLQYVDFEKVFNKNLLSEVTDIDQFVRNKRLLKKAKALQDIIKEQSSRKISIS